MTTRARAFSQAAPPGAVARGRRCSLVTRSLMQELREGGLSPGTKLPALRDLAARFKVSTNTIRNAIRSLEAEGHLYHVRAVGTFVRPLGPAPEAVSQATIALVTTDIGASFGMGIAQGIERACRERGWKLQIYDDRLDPRLEIDNLSRLTSSEASGAIIVPTCDDLSIETLFKLKLSNYPVVLLDRSLRGLAVDYVGTDHRKGAYIATEHLIQQGHRRILMLAGHPICSSVEERIAGYEQALCEYGLPSMPPGRIWFGRRLSGGELDEWGRWRKAYEAIMPVLKTARFPMAIFAVNEYAAWGIIEACREIGLRVPEDVSIACFDDSELTQAAHPPLTAVAQPLMELGEQAVALLEGRMSTPYADARRVVLEPELIARKSVLHLNRPPLVKAV